MNARLFWLTQTLAEVPENDDWLSSGETARLSRMRFPKRRDDWRLGRWTAKKAVCSCCPEDVPGVTSLEIRSAEDGAPEVFWSGRLLNVSISISHSQGRGFCVVCPGSLALGCDLEFIEPREEQFAEDYFTPGERDFLIRVPDSERVPVLNLLWSAKETMLKALRQGLRRDTRSVAVSAGGWDCADGWRRWMGRCLESRLVFHGWWRREGAFVYTMAADRPTAVPEEAAGAAIAI